MACEGGFHLLKMTNKRAKLGYLILPKIAVTNTDRKLLEKIQKLTGLGKIYSAGRPQSPRHKQAYYWTIIGIDKVLSFCEEILPYLPSKRGVAKCLIEWTKSRTSKKKIAPYSEREIELVEEIRKLNKRGL